MAYICTVILRLIFSISLLCLFLSNSVFKAALIFNYWQNTNEIIADCCINKNKPELRCEGKCFINTQLNKINSRTNEELPGKLMEKDFELFITPFTSYSVQFFFTEVPLFDNLKNEYSCVFSSSVFQPPAS